MKSAPDSKEIKVFIAGVGLRGSGYPNAWNTIRILRKLSFVDIIECGTWLPESFRLWRFNRKPRVKVALQFSYLLVANALSVIRLLFRNRNRSMTYVPYPSLFFLWFVSWLPKRWRPRCICDSYISIWDALYQDRKMGNAASPMARLLLRFESRALQAAEIVLVDTRANAEHVSCLFDVPRDRIRSFPLALDASSWVSLSHHTKESCSVRVLFIGTFVPLQGAALIAQAINDLRRHECLEFVLIGDGQQADEAARWLGDHPTVTWLRDWQSPHVLAGHLAEADICLGVFGGGGKASRVLPFKLYLALAAGKAIITQEAYSTPGTPAIPALAVPPIANALKDAILELANNPARRARLGQAAAIYYREHLGEAAITRAWRELLQMNCEQ
jgi:glycosyltransferase involved in cell wall biosynthesis